MDARSKLDDASRTTVAITESTWRARLFGSARFRKVANSPDRVLYRRLAYALWALTSSHRLLSLSYLPLLPNQYEMARNEEKAQSMLYRFREAQAAELGLGTRADRRPRMASACKSLRECERWRGEILREISRKVSKIQDGTYYNSTRSLS